jgi:hypothetical protein
LYGNKLEAGPIYEVGATDNVLVRVYAMRRGQFRVRYYENGKRISKDTTGSAEAVKLANEINARLEHQLPPASRGLTRCSGEGFRVSEAEDKLANETNARLLSENLARVGREN